MAFCALRPARQIAFASCKGNSSSPIPSKPVSGSSAGRKKKYAISSDLVVHQKLTYHASHQPPTNRLSTSSKTPPGKGQLAINRLSADPPFSFSFFLREAYGFARQNRPAPMSATSGVNVRFFFPFSISIPENLATNPTRPTSDHHLYARAACDEQLGRFRERVTSKMAKT